MPPRRFKKKSVRKIVEKRVAKAIEKYEKTRADSNNVGRSGSTNTGGTVVPEMHGCLYQTFMNGKPQSFNGGPEGCSRKKTETVGLKKMEQVFEICNCAEDDKVKFALVQSRRGSCSNLGWTGNCSRFGDLLMANQFLDLLKQQKIEKVHSLISAKESKETSLLQSLRPCMRQSTWPVNWSSNQFRENVRAYAAAPAGGHMKKDCKVRLQGAGNDFLQNVTCFGCGEKGHFKDKCPKAGNQQNDRARGRAYVVIENPQQNLNLVTGTFLLNDHYACILFDFGAEKSFVSSAFTPFINISPATLNTSYEVELADRKVVSTNTILRSCTLVLLNHVFKINLLPTRLGSFDVIIGMDWLAYH
ncbi:putative reverse transcriptase domain-containing protein [Tanacetum coccineum]